MTCLRGAVFDVVVDIRVGSPTFGQWDSVLLDDRDRRSVYISEGLGHAFLALEDDSTVMYLCSAGYDPGREHTINALDPALASPGPAAANRSLSDRDRERRRSPRCGPPGLLPTWDEDPGISSPERRDAALASLNEMLAHRHRTPTGIAGPASRPTSEPAATRCSIAMRDAIIATRLDDMGEPMTACASSCSLARARRSAQASTSRSSRKPDLARTIRDSSRRYHLAVVAVPQADDRSCQRPRVRRRIRPRACCAISASPRRTRSSAIPRSSSAPRRSSRRCSGSSARASRATCASPAGGSMPRRRIAWVWSTRSRTPTASGRSDGDRSGDGRSAAAGARSHQALPDHPARESRSTRRSTVEHDRVFDEFLLGGLSSAPVQPMRSRLVRRRDCAGPCVSCALRNY